MSKPPSVVVVGSVNIDIVATVDKLPVAGETVTGASLNRFPGGKGANQALAAKRLGAEVAFVACVGNDADADEALSLLSAGGVNLEGCSRIDSASTGVGLIAVSLSGENQIVVASGANQELYPGMFTLPEADAMICQLEIPIETIVHAVTSFPGFISMNLAPAMDVPDAIINRANLIVVNEIEAGFYGSKLQECDALLATTYGEDGALLTKAGKKIARSKPPMIEAVDTTGAGDTFTAALTVAIVEGMELQSALDFACAAGAATATKPGAQPSLPFRSDVESLLA